MDEPRDPSGEDIIRPLVEGDAQRLLDLRVANRAFMKPFEPHRPRDFFTLERQRSIARNDDGLKFAVLDGNEIAGIVTLSNVVGAPLESAGIGYWIDRGRNGRGLASRAVAAVMKRAFGPLGLHRLEASTLVDNIASQRVLAKNGFETIGLARRLLKIDGAWRDHLLFQRLSDDPESLRERRL